jgi:hypothetical protein
MEWAPTTQAAVTTINALTIPFVAHSILFILFVS